MQVIGKVIDCFEPLSAAYAQSLKQSGYVGVARYLGQLSHGLQKAMTPGEVALIRDAGLKIVSIWELNPTYKAYFTHTQGTLDGHQAAQDARSLGQPAGSAIYFTVDYDAQDADMDDIRAYVSAVKAAVGEYKVGIYGSYTVVSNVTADYYWQTAAWSQGAISPRAAMLQNTFNTTVDGRNVDIDEVYKNPAWWPGPPKEVGVVSYNSFNVVVNGHVFKAIAVNNATYVIWTAATFANSSVADPVPGDGKLTINGKEVDGVIYNGDTYLPWESIGRQVSADKVLWNFNVTNT